MGSKRDRNGRSKKITRSPAARPVHVTVNVSQIVGGTAEPVVEASVTDEETSLDAVAPGAIGFRVDGDAEPETPDEARKRR